MMQIIYVDMYLNLLLDIRRLNEYIFWAHHGLLHVTMLELQWLPSHPYKGYKPIHSGEKTPTLPPYLWHIYMIYLTLTISYTLHVTMREQYICPMGYISMICESSLQAIVVCNSLLPHDGPIFMRQNTV